MTDADLPNRLVYDQVLLMRSELAKTREEVAAYTARSDARLDHGARKLDDHEARLRVVEELLPADLPVLLADVREDHGQRRGRSAVWSHLLTLAGSSTLATLVSYWLAHR